MISARRLKAVAAVVPFLVVGLLGVVNGSNSGFKLIYTLRAGDSGVTSLSGNNSLALPFIPELGIENASDLFQDIGYQNLVEIQKFLPATDNYQPYSLNSPDFAIEPGEGYFVKMAQTIDYRIVGSHDPGLAIVLSAVDPPNNASGNNFVTLPYNATVTTASELFEEIGYQNVVEIQRFLPATDGTQVYSLNSPDFSLAPGEAYFIKMSNTYAWTPSHY